MSKPYHSFRLSRCWFMNGCIAKALFIPTYSNAYANAKKWNFNVQFPGNWFELGIIGNEFWSFYNLDFLDPSFNRCLKIPQLPEFHNGIKVQTCFSDQAITHDRTASNSVYRIRSNRKAFLISAFQNILIFFKAVIRRLTYEQWH